MALIASITLPNGLAFSEAYIRIRDLAHTKQIGQDAHVSIQFEIWPGKSQRDAGLDPVWGTSHTVCESLDPERPGTSGTNPAYVEYFGDPALKAEGFCLHARAYQYLKDYRYPGAQDA